MTETEVRYSTSGLSPGGALPWWRRWRTRLVAIFVVVALTFGALEIARAIRAFGHWRDEALAGHSEVAGSLATATELFVARYTAVAQTAAEAIFGGRATPDGARRLLAAIRRAHPEIIALAAVGADGRVLAADPAQVTPYDLSNRPYYERIRGGASVVVSDLLIGALTGTPDIVVAGAARAPDGALRGVVTIRPPVATFIGELKPWLHGNAYALVVDRNGRIVVHGEHADLDWSRRDYSSVPIVVEALAGRPARSSGFTSPASGERVLGAMAPVAGLGWAAGVVQPVDDAMGAARGGLQVALALTVGSLALGVGVAVLLGTTLSRPIVALAGGVAAVARGDLAHRVEVRSRDEFGQLAADFNAMAARLEAARRQEDASTEEGRRAQARAAFLAEASARMAASLDYEATLRSVARLVVPVLADGCLIDVVETDRAVRPLAVAHVDPLHESLLREMQERVVDPQGTDPVAVVLRTGRPQLVPEADEAWIDQVAVDAAHRDLLRRLASRSFMAVPLVARGRTIGVLSLISSESGRAYGPADLVFAEDLAQRAAFAMDNARLFRAAQEAIRQAQGAIRSRDAFLARASHELRTPLTSALGTIRLLRKAFAGQLRETPDQLVVIAARNLEAMAVLINDLLDASKLAAGRERLALAPVALSAVVEASIDVVGAQARDKGVTVRNDAPSDLTVIGDRLKLEQVFTNLLGNAVKFTPAGGEVVVGAAIQAGRVLVRVRDTGEGVLGEHLESIFEPFFQGDATQGRKPRGTGLGLAICRQIVTLHRGTIWAESEGLGRGSTFVVSLPVAVADDCAA